MPSIKTTTAGAIVFVALTGAFVQNLCADDCPCGSVSNPWIIRMLTPQEAYGADFRPSCRAHDACYEAKGANRRACDRKFQKDLRCACERATHPRLCRAVAQVMYISVRVGGMRPFRNAQRNGR